MTAKQIFAALGIACGILFFVFGGTHDAFVAGGLISVGVSVIIP